jgi:hypothetical protein
LTIHANTQLPLRFVHDSLTHLPEATMTRATLLLVWLSVAAIAGSCGRQAPSSGTPPLAFVTRVDHRFFPLRAGTLHVFAGEDGGAALREEVQVLAGTRLLGGVHCTGVEETTWLDGELFERTTEWYAQDTLGQVWQFGEESLMAADGGWVVAADSWLAGVDGALPMVAFPAELRVGDRFVRVHPGGADEFAVTSTSASIITPAGVFFDCLELVENPDDPEDQDVILYAPGVGRVFDVGSQSKSSLIAVHDD